MIESPGSQSINTLLHERLLPNPRDVEKPFDGPGGIYQWRKRCFDGVTVLQIPHFSWARSLAKLEGFAAWLREELRPFGLDSGCVRWALPVVGGQ